MREKLLSVQYKFSIIIELIIELKADLFMSRKNIFPSKICAFFMKYQTIFHQK
jgi:hypothetical protein